MRLILICVSFLFLYNVHAQKGEATIYFKDGRVLKGFAKIKINARVKYSATKKSDKVIYHFRDINRIHMDDKVYVYVKVKGMEKPMILEEIKSGKVNLYKKVIEYDNPNSATGSIGNSHLPPMMYGNHFSISSYYVQKKGEIEATNLGSTHLFSRNFKKAASDYFKDCPSLVKKIQNKELKKKHIEEIVAYYNENCN